MAELIVTGPDGPRRGSGYRVSRDAVLTAAHVVEGAASVDVRFEPDLPGQWMTGAVSWWVDVHTDIALLVITPGDEDGALAAAAFSRLGDRPGTLDVQAVGFPRWKMRTDAESGEGRPGRYRDSFHAIGQVSTLSNSREGTLEVRVESTPATEPGSSVSPWEGMSGAALWAGNRIIGVVSKHHPGDGVSMLTAARIERAGEVTDPHVRQTLRDLLGLPEHSADLPLPGQEPTELVEVCPYPTGMKAFSREQAEWFFGRDELTDELVERLDQSLLYGTGPAIVVAPSGAGKSSLLQAGLAPRLDQAVLPGSRYWPRVLMTPTDDPMSGITTELAKVLGDEPTTVGTQLAEEPDRVVERLRRVLYARRPTAQMPPPRLLLIVDQLEELFTMCPDRGERHRFLDLLSRLADTTPSGQEPVALIVYGLRADFYARCADHPQLRTALQHNQVFVRQMTQDELRDAICKPAEHAGLEVQKDLVEVMIHDLGTTSRHRADLDGGAEAGRLPLLAHALRATWFKREGNTVTLAGYQATGGIEKAVEMTANSVYTTLHDDEKKIARAVFLRLVKLGDDASDTRRRVARDELLQVAPEPERIRKVLDDFTRARLLTQAQDTVEITHEALLHAWPTLHDWINEDRAGNLVRQQLNEAAAAWEAEGHDTGALYRGARLEAAREQTSGEPRDADVSPAAWTFLNVSTRQENRAVRRRRTLVVALSLLTVLSLIAAYAANWQRNVATANQLTSQADRALEGGMEGADVSLSAQLNLAAYKVNSDDEQIKTKLYNAGNTPLSARVTGHGDAVRSVALSPDGRTLASGGDDGTVRLWDVAGPGKATPLGDPLTGQGPVHSVAFGPDGRTLASGGDDGTVRLRDVTAPGKATPLGDPLTGQGPVHSVAFSPDGRTLASTDSGNSGYGTVRLWDVADPGKAAPIGEIPPGTTDSVSTSDVVTFSPGGRMLAVGGDDGTVQLWNVVAPGQAVPLGGPLPGHGDVVRSVAFSPDGRTLAAGADDGTIRLWGVTGSGETTPTGDPKTAHNGPVHSVAFSPDGRTLASGGSGDGEVRLWGVAGNENATPLGEPLTGQGSVHSVVFSSDGRTLVSGSGDGTVKVWGIPDNQTELSSDVRSVAFSPDGRKSASGSADGTVRVWGGAGSGKAVPVGEALTGPGSGIRSVAFSSDGRRLLSSSADGTVRWWDVAGPGKAVPIGEALTSESNSTALSPDGRTLASGGFDGTVRLWDVADPGKATPIGDPVAGHDGPVLSVAFSPDGRTFASGGDETVRVWDVARRGSAAPLGAPLTGHTDSVYAVAFSPDGRTLASGGFDETVRLWDVADPGKATSIGDPLIGHSFSVEAVAFSPDGRTLASGGFDETVRLWDVADPGNPTSIGDPLTGHSGGINSMAFSPDGHILVAGSYEKILFQDLDIDQAVDRICNTTSNYITPEVWRKHFPREEVIASPCSDS